MENLKNDMSLLKVKVYSGNDAFPVANAKVVISKVGKVEAFLITDENGATPFVKLPAPVKDLSLSDTGKESYDYRADIYADGFKELKNLYISLSGGTSSTLKVNMIPLYKGGEADA